MFYEFGSKKSEKLVDIHSVDSKSELSINEDRNLSSEEDEEKLKKETNGLLWEQNFSQIREKFVELVLTPNQSTYICNITSTCPPESIELILKEIKPRMIDLLTNQQTINFLLILIKICSAKQLKIFFRQVKNSGLKIILQKEAGVISI